MLKSTSTSILKNKKGMAILEAIPILIVIVLFLNFSLGFFGVIHSGILNSIASRNYAFETFRHRANLKYFRNVTGVEKISYEKTRSRVHGTVSEVSAVSQGKEWTVTSRPIDFFNFSKRGAEVRGDTSSEHSKTRSIASGRVTESVHGGVNPVWIKTIYGICLDSICEPQ